MSQEGHAGLSRRGWSVIVVCQSPANDRVDVGILLLAGVVDHRKTVSRKCRLQNACEDTHEPIINASRTSGRDASRKPQKHKDLRKTVHAGVQHMSTHRDSDAKSYLSHLQAHDRLQCENNR